MYPLSSFYASLSQSRFPVTPAGPAGYGAEQLLRARPPHLVYPLAARPQAVGVSGTVSEEPPDGTERAADRLAEKCRPVLKFSVNAILGDDKDDREEQPKKGEQMSPHQNVYVCYSLLRLSRVILMQCNLICKVPGARL